MSITTVQPPAVEVERASREKVAALMLRAVRDHGLTWPRNTQHMEDRPSGESLLCVDVDTMDEWRAWHDYFGPDRFNLPPRDFSAQILWQGWIVMLNITHQGKVKTLDAETAALIDEVTAEPARCSSTYYGGPCPGEDIQADGRCPQHTSLAAAEMVEALQRGPSNLATYSTDAINAALADRVIITVTPAGGGHHLYALPVDPITAIAEDRPIDLGTVGGHFADRWAHVNVLKRAELVHACQIAGWTGDWDACWRHVMGGATTAELHGDMALAVSELDDCDPIDAMQLAEARVVDPDSRIDLVPVDDEVLTAEQRHCHTIDVTAVNAELADAGRGGAAIARTIGGQS